MRNRSWRVEGAWLQRLSPVLTLRDAGVIEVGVGILTKSSNNDEQ